MTERNIEIKEVDPVQFFGVNNANLKTLKKEFPDLTITARGEMMKVVGKETVVSEFEEKISLLLEHLKRFKELTATNVERIVGSTPEEIESIMDKDGDEALVHGAHGLSVKARTANQRKLVRSVLKHDMVFAIGPAGTGKTYVAVALAARALKNKQVKRIILTRPAVEAGESLGFLPGDLKEKLDPFLQPLYDALHDMFPAERLKDYMETGVVQIAPLAYMRGRTLDNAFVILDEAQNATKNQFKMFLTRMGKNAKFMITGDMSQVDLPRNQVSGLKDAVDVLRHVKGMDFIFFDEKDVVRHPLVRSIIDAYNMVEKNQRPANNNE